MWEKIKNAHWKTTLCGMVALVCGANNIIQVLPEDVKVVVNGACGIAIGLGLIAAADGKNVVKPNA